ncbi:hypothetical protein [Sphingobacterium anhuiense]|uniref:YD repeat-containing protein n=1 Tax=Sphingobacterium anhuiense TaxID=493780 RepID=A0ABW5YV90_9SPHI
MKINLRTAFYVSVIILIFPLKVLSQQANDKEGFKITPVSPNTASLGLYGQIPVGHYTGVPNIDIPLYEIDLDGKKIPISISYHGSGIRLAQEASSLGLGWTLNLAGCITKSVNGEDDFVASNGAFKSYYSDNPNLEELKSDLYVMTKPQLSEKYWPYFNFGGKGEPDMYYYNFAGFSGKMMFDRVGTTYKGFTNTQTAAKAILLNPKSYLDITYNFPGGWVVKDLDGYTYGFEEAETSMGFSLNSSGLLSKSDKELREIPFNNQGVQTTAFYLTFIESPLKNRVTFHYEKEYFYTPIVLNEQLYSTNDPDLLEFDDATTIPTTHIQLARKYHDFTYSYSKITQLRPTGVTFNGGTIQINATSPRIDLLSIVNENVPKGISSVIIKDSRGNLVKSFSFVQSYRGWGGSSDFDYLNKRLMLDRIVENNGAQHTFVYNLNDLPPKNSFETDFWGFYNMGQIEGSPKAFETVPTVSMVGEILYGRDKRPKPQLLQNMMLNQIKYPTGGTSDFYYEPHNINQNISYLFNKLKSSGVSAAILGKDYNNPCDIYGTTGKVVTSEVFEINSYVDGIKLEMRVGKVNSSSISCGGSSTSFTVWLEKFDGNNYVEYKPPLMESGRYDFYAAHSQLNFVKTNNRAFGGLPEGKYRLKLLIGVPGYVNFSVYAGIEYLEPTLVSEIVQGGAGLRIQKIVNNSGGQDETRSFIYKGTTSMYNPEFTRTQIVAPGYYTASSLIGYPFPDFNLKPSSIYSISSTSSIVPFSNAAQGNIVGYREVRENMEGNGYTDYVFENNANRLLGAGAEKYIPYFPTMENFLNGSTKSKSTYDKNGVIIQKDTFNYKVSIVKNFPVFKTFVPRPLRTIDGAFIGFYDVKVEESILDNKTTTSFVNGIAAQEVKEDYLYDPAYSLLTSVKMTGSQGKIKQQLIKYPFNYSDAVSIGMINKNLKGIPVEKISLIDNKVIAASRTEYKDTLSTYLPSKTYSFNSTLPQVLTAYSNFYKNDYTFTKYNSKGKLLEFLNPDKTFTSYLWDNLSLYPIAVIKNATYTQALAAFNGFDFSGIGSVNSSKELVVRTNLPNSMVNTYTYKPLVGMTSKTDPRGVTEYYEYDIYQRLKAIIDQAKNVTSALDYHYRPN